MSDVFAVGLKAFNEDLKSAIIRTGVSASNASIAVTNEIGGGITGLLSLLTVIGASLSIVGVVLAFITYSLFSDLRTVSGTSLLNLLASLFLAHLVLVVGVERTSDSDLCFAVGIILHYLWLSAQCWLVVMYKDMHSTFRDNINLQPSLAAERGKSFIKYTLFAWGFPLLSSGLAAFIHFRTDLDNSELVTPTCWILGKGSFGCAFAIPFFVLAASQVPYSIKSAILIKYTASLQVTPKARDKMKKRRYLQLFLYCKIAVLFLTTWVSCLLSQLTDSMTFWFSFTILASLQGFVVSLAYCCNSKVFRLYSKSFKAASGKPGYGASELSRSTSLALLTWQPSPDAV